MTYKQLLRRLQQMDDAELNSCVIINDSEGDYFLALGVCKAQPYPTQMLTVGQPYIAISSNPFI
jgi:uncharacterized protein YqiB (DUF1249 family)